MSYALSGVSSADVVGSQLIGTTTVDATGRAVVAVTLAADALTEGAETLTLTAAGKTAFVNVNDTSTTPAPVVPPVAPVASYALAAGSTTLNEGAGVNFVLTTKNVPSGSTISYTIGGEVKSDDIVGGSLVGTTTVGVDGVAVFNIGLVNDLRTDGDENMTVTVGGQTVTVKVLDTSKAPPAQPTTIPLTAGPDTLGSATAPAQQNFVASIADSLSAFDSLTGVPGGTDTLSANLTATILPSAITIKNIPTVNLTSSGAGFTADTSTAAWAGVTNLSVSANNTLATPVSITAATSTNVIASNGGGAGGSMAIVGGKDVSTTQSGTTGGNLSITRETGAVTVNDAQFGNTIVVSGGTSNTITSTNVTANTATITVGGSTTAAPAPTGAVAISASSAFPNNTSAGMGAVSVTGGTTISVTENIAQAGTVTADGTGTFTSGAVSVTGSALTTAVTVNQTAAAVASATSRVANPGALGVTAITAATGVQGVVGVTSVAGARAATPSAGVVDGAVTIADAGTLQTSAGTISSVTLNNYANSTIASNALNTLNLGGTAGTLSITNNNTAQIAARANTLAVNFNGPTGLSVTPTGSATSNTITDVNNEISTVNFNTGIVSSTLTGFVDSSLTTINVSSAGATANDLTLTTLPGSLTALNVTGTAGFSDGASSAVTGTGLSSLGAALTIVDSSSGAFNAAINDTTQTFTNTGSGANRIIVSSLQNATRTITAGSGTTDELRLEGGAYALTSASTGRFVGFETLGVAANVTGTIDVSLIMPGATRLNLPSAGTTVTFTKAPTNAAIVIGGTAGGDTLSVGYVDSAGPTDVVPVTLTGASVTSLTLADAVGTGIGTVNLASNISGTTQYSTTNANTITTLVDNGLSTLNVTGTSGLIITTLNEATTPAATFTLNNNSTSTRGATITTFTDASLNTLTFSGSGTSAMTTVNTSSPTLTVTNSGAALATIGTLVDNSLTSLTLGANVMLGNASIINSAVGLQNSNTSGITINGSADNAHVTVNLAGAGAGRTDSITLGNGNNYVLDTSTAGTVTVTVGSGANFIQLGSTNANSSGTYTVNLGSRANTLWNQVMVGTGGTNFASAPNYIITGANNGDAIGFLADTNSSSTLTTVNLASATTVAAAIALLTGTSGINGVAGRVATGVFGGNTLVVQSATGTTGAADTTVIQINGTPTLTAGAGGITIGTVAATPFTAPTVSNSFQVSAATTNAVTLGAGANTVTFNSLTTTQAQTTTLTSVAGTGNVTITDNALAAALNTALAFVNGAGTAATTDATGLTITNATNTNAAANTMSAVAFTAPNLTSLTLNASGVTAASNITLTSLTANSLSTITVGGSTNVANVVSIPTLVDTFAGAVTINDTSATTGTTLIGTTAITLGASSLTINDTSVATGGGALTFGTTGSTYAALGSLTINQTGAGNGAITVNTFTSPLSTLTIAGNGAKAITLNGVTNSATGAVTLNDSSTSAVTLTAYTMTAATSFTVNDSSTQALTIPSFTDTALVSATLNNTGTALLTATGILTTGGANTFTTLTLAGTGPETITTFTGSETTGTVAINDSNSGLVTITTLNNATTTTGGLTITNSGSGNLVIPTYAAGAAQLGTLSINNTGTGAISIGGTAMTTPGSATLNINAAGGLIIVGNTIADNTLASSTITGNVSGLTLTTSNAGAVAITQSGPNPNATAYTLSAAALTASHTFTNSGTGAGNGAITVSLGGTSGTGFTNTVNLFAGHTGIDTVTFTATNGGTTTGTVVPPTAGTAVINDFSTTLSATLDVINLTGITTVTGARAVQVGAINTWAIGTTNSVFLETGTFLPTGIASTYAQVSAALGTLVSAYSATNAVGAFAIQTGAATGVYDIYQVTIGAAHVTGAALTAGVDTIALVGVVNVTPGQALVGTNFTP